MATVKPFIRTINKKKNTKVRFRLSDGVDVQLFYISDIEVNPLQFDTKKGYIKDKVVIDENLRQQINSSISNIKDVITQIYNKRRSSDVVSTDWLSKRVDNYLNKSTNETVKNDFFLLFERFVPQAQICDDRVKHYTSTFRLLKRFDTYMKYNDISFYLDLSTIDADIWYKFLNYVQYEGDQTKGLPLVFDDNDVIRNRSYNTMVAIWKRVKAFLNWAILNKHSTNVAHKMVKIKPEVYSTPYYISIEERNIIYNYDFGGDKRLEVQRDIFIFHCLIGCRVGDLIELKKNSIINGAVEYVANKTMNERANIIRVPLNKTALSIIDKYKDVEGDELLPFISAQKYNDAIKAIFNKVELTRLVTVIDSATGKEKKVPLNTTASSHLARRTFVGNLYKKVQDPNLVGALSGHSEGSKAFARYREIDEDIKKDLINLLD